FYKNGKIVFLDELMDFETYLRFLHSCDGLVMNHMRPQGYGNIFMMMYMNKPVLLNRKNISLPDLEAAGIRWMPIDEAANLKPGTSIANKSQIVEMLSHDKLITLYQNLFR
ncbi:MAG TPA: TDP-N-acetylfucosamine:lipid II N-acetylfucosaminyltransferase, partial [Chryseosolibacter sp.]